MSDSLVTDAANVDGERFLKMLEDRGYLSRAALVDVGSGPHDGLEWLCVVALNHKATIAPRAVGETALFTLEVDALDAAVFDKVAHLRKSGWQIVALPTSRSILIVLMHEFQKPVPS
jgi:hypothetical protein